MYMAMIGMAIVAVPRGVFRALVWLVMVVVGWCVSAVNAAFADAWASFSGGKITVNCDGDGNPDTVSVYFEDGGMMNPDSVWVSDGNSATSPSLMTTNPGAVTAIEITGDSGNDFIDVGVFAGDGFSGLDGDVTINGGYGDDTIIGTDFADLIIGDSGADVMDGWNGNDTAYAATPGGPTTADGADDYFQGWNGTDTYGRNTDPDHDQDNSVEVYL